MDDGRTMVLFTILREESALFEVRCTTVWLKLKKLINSAKQPNFQLVGSPLTNETSVYISPEVLVTSA